MSADGATKDAVQLVLMLFFVIVLVMCGVIFYQGASRDLSAPSSQPVEVNIDP